jgi:CheY-like chemotaxis protein
VQDRLLSIETLEDPDLRQFDFAFVSLVFQPIGDASTNWDGLQTIRKIRNWEEQTNQTKALPVIAMSKLRALVHDYELSMIAGADLFLQQPVTLHLLDPLDTGSYT